MGGRMSGESPREEKLSIDSCGIRAERPYQANDEVVSGTPITVPQTSGQQQLTACDPPGQQGLCAA